MVSILAFTACGTKEVKVAVATDSPVQKTAHEVMEANKVKSEFSNPGFMAGSSFGEFFISMLRTQNYDMALRFTSKGSKNKFGMDVILDKYNSFKFNYKLTQKSMSQVGDTITIVYATNEMATGKLKKMTVVLENDTCKLVLPDNLEDLLK